MRNQAIGSGRRLLISPTERHPAIKALGEFSSLPEKFGVDILWWTENGWAGVQRKEVSDYVLSLRDGRLGKECEQMQSLTFRSLLIEGRMKWTTDGALLDKGFGTQFTKAQYYGSLWSIQQKGVWIAHTDGAGETAETTLRFQTWSEKDTHNSLSRRPHTVPKWANRDNRDYAIRLVCGLPEVGPELGGRIVDTLGIPFAWKEGIEERLAGIKGIGKGKLKKIMEIMDYG